MMPSIRLLGNVMNGSATSNLKFSVAMPGKQPVVALFKGQPGSDPTITDLGAAGNTNEDTGSAYRTASPRSR